MITILVLEDERKIHELLSDFLRKEGYSFVNEPESKGLIKIIKKVDSQKQTLFKDRIFEIKNYLLIDKEGKLYKTTLADLEKELIESVLERTQSNQLKAAKILGINRNTLRAKIKKLGIEVGKWKS